MEGRAKWRNHSVRRGKAVVVKEELKEEGKRREEVEKGGESRKGRG